jgi:hypothetical protein
VPKEGKFYALVRAVFMDPHRPAEHPDLLSCDGGFLRFLREQMKGFYDLRQNPSSLFIFLKLSSILIASPIF